jgi:hypothetical protein
MHDTLNLRSAKAFIIGDRSLLHTDGMFDGKM